jgi:Mg-chelatase subunit ChlD
MRNLITLGADGKLALRAENGTETALTPWKAHNVLLLIDTSGSMAGAKIEQAKAGAVDFAQSASLKGYATGLAIFADRAAMVSDPQPDAKILARKLTKLDVGLVGSTTNLTAGLALAEKFSDLSALVIVTDGQMTGTDGLPADPQSILARAATLKSRGVDIICIGTDDADQKFLKSLATRGDLATHVPPHGVRSAISDASHLLPTCDSSSLNIRTVK